MTRINDTHPYESPQIIWWEANSTRQYLNWVQGRWGTLDNMGLRSILKPAKEVPVTWWSSTDPMEPRPRPSTLLILCVGLWIFGTGDAVIVAAGVGNTPWTVLAEGIALMMDRTIGQATFFVSVAVLLLWIPLREKPGIGTILNAILIAVAIEYMLPILPTPEGAFESLLQVIGGIALVGIGSGIYLTANLGPGLEMDG